MHVCQFVFFSFIFQLGIKKKKTEEAESSKPQRIVFQAKERRPAKYTRVVGKRKTNTERKPYYDEKDKAALKLMRKLRVDWSTGEDSFLLLCKVNREWSNLIFSQSWALAVIFIF